MSDCCVYCACEIAKSLRPNGRYHKAPAWAIIDHQWSMPRVFRPAVMCKCLLCWWWRWSAQCNVITGGRAICISRRQHLASVRIARAPGVCGCHFQHLWVYVRLIMRLVMFFVCSLFLRFYFCVFNNIVLSSLFLVFFILKSRLEDGYTL